MTAQRGRPPFDDLLTATEWEVAQAVCFFDDPEGRPLALMSQTEPNG